METALSEALRLIQQELEAIRGLLEWLKADTLAERAAAKEQERAYLVLQQERERQSLAEQEAMVVRQMEATRERNREEAEAARERYREDEERYRKQRFEDNLALGRQLALEACRAHGCKVGDKPEQESNG